MRLDTETIVAATGAEVYSGGMHPEFIGGWSIDSRTIERGDCFFALHGAAHDGHQYVERVFELGAAAAVVERPSGSAGFQLKVEDCEKALRDLAREARSLWGGRVIGVTGSAGKTTVKETIASLIAVEYATGRNHGNLNNHLGLPLSILRLPHECRIAVLEMGMNHSGEIRLLAGIAAPDIGVVTNVGWAHAENFANGIEGIALAKRELIESLPREGVAVLNADDKRVREFASVYSGRTILFGFAEDAQVRAEDVRFGMNGASFRALGVEFESPLSGRHGVSNVLAGIAVAHAMGIAPERLRDAVRGLAPGPMRGERRIVRGVTVIDDSYNANPEAMRSMIEVLRDIPAKRRVAVLGEMLELGRESESLHRLVGEFAAAQKVDALIGVHGVARTAVDAAISAGLPADSAFYFDTPEAAGGFLRDYLKTGDAVLFKGSRGVRVEKALAAAFPGEG